MNQEIKVYAYFTTVVDATLTKEQLIQIFSGSGVVIDTRLEDFRAVIEVIDIEEEAEIYGNEP